MALNRKVSALTGGVTDKQAEQATQALKARKSALLTWDMVSHQMPDNFDRTYLWQVANGKRPPSRRLLRALGVIKPERRTGIRVRMSAEEAREIVDYGTIPADVVNRIGYQLWGVK